MGTFENCMDEGAGCASAERSSSSEKNCRCKVIGGGSLVCVFKRQLEGQVGTEYREIARRWGHRKILGFNPGHLGSLQHRENGNDRA